MIRYSIAWQSPADRLYDITISFTASTDDPRLHLPAWRPGRYLIQNYAAQVREWSAGEARVWKDGKSSWRFRARAGEEVTFRYRFYAGVLDAGSSFLNDGEAYFNGTNLFMMVEGLRESECSLTIAAPHDWLIETQLPRAGDNTFRARDYDHLIDSPVICAARITRHSFHESGARVHLVFVGDEGVETEQYVEPVRAIVRTQAAIFGGLPLREYRFLTHIADLWHGVEHEDSCSIVAKRDALGGDEDRFLSIASHEFFHVWNVKRMLPAVFHPYDYSRETLTRLLWVVEGITSYYGGLTLFRSGVWDEERYLKHLATQIETLENQPGRLILSLEQASFDAWLQGEVHDRDNALISFYNKGEIVGTLLDMTIRRATGGQKSLDDVMRILWEKRVLEESAFRDAVAAVANVGDFFERYVEGVEPLPYADVFDAEGIEFTSAPEEPPADSRVRITLRRVRRSDD